MGIDRQSKESHPTVVPAIEKLVVIIQILSLESKGCVLLKRIRALWSAIY